MSAPILLSRRLVMDEQTARRMAIAVLRYTLTTTRAIMVVGVLVVVGGVFIANGDVLTGVLLFACLAVAAGLTPLRARSLAKVLTARGFQPGGTLVLDYSEVGWTVTAPGFSAYHRYEEITRARTLSDAVLFQLSTSKMLIVLPREVVAGELAARAAK